MMVQQAGRCDDVTYWTGTATTALAEVFRYNVFAI